MIHKYNFIERILLNLDVIAHPFFDAAINSGLSRALAVSVKLGLTEKLNDNYQSVAELAQQTEADPKGAELLLNCLHALGYVDRSAQGYKLSKSQLAKGMTSFMALNLFHQTSGNAYPFEEVKSWANKIGYASAKIAKLNVPGFGLISLTK